MRRLRAGLATAALVGLALTGCGGGSAAGRFDNQAGESPLRCLAHQKDKPGTDYTGREKAATGPVLAMLRYYTANGNKPYCDGKPPTEQDRAWARLFVDLGAEPERVQRILP
jgi:hypothetical protein